MGVRRRRTFMHKSRWFIVIEVKGSWFVDCEGKSHGPFRTKEEAILDGTRLARTLNDAERQNEIWVKDDATGAPRRLWSGPVPNVSASGVMH
jgi:hypothetical protein